MTADQRRVRGTFYIRKSVPFNEENYASPQDDFMSKRFQRAFWRRPAWIQAHGHTQLFGWMGTFILGIGFYSIPKLRKLKPFALWSAWLTWALCVVGVTPRWLSNIYPWHWRAECCARLIRYGEVSSMNSATRKSKAQLLVNGGDFQETLRITNVVGYAKQFG
jgi:hypothetical protein